MPKWQRKALKLIRQQSGPFRMEQIRMQIKRGPRRHQKWGAFTISLMKDAVIIPVGFGRATSRKTHCHRVGVYRRAA